MPDGSLMTFQATFWKRLIRLFESSNKTTITRWEIWSKFGIFRQKFCKILDSKIRFSNWIQIAFRISLYFRPKFYEILDLIKIRVFRQIFRLKNPFFEQNSKHFRVILYDQNFFFHFRSKDNFVLDLRVYIRE